jgi:16S rRNA processing protein RimM
VAGPEPRLPEYVIVGRVRRAHGVNGEVVVESLTDSPDVIFAPGRRLFAGTTRGDVSAGTPQLHVRSAFAHQRALVVAFAEIADRYAADLWRNRYLLVPRDELPGPNEDEIYLHELVGLRVETPDGVMIGTVDAFYELAQGLMLEVRVAPESRGATGGDERERAARDYASPEERPQADGDVGPAETEASRSRSLLLPYRHEFVRRVDVKQGMMVVELPEGLVD